MDLKKELIKTAKDVHRIGQIIKVIAGLYIIHLSAQAYDNGFIHPLVEDFPMMATLLIGVMFGLLIMR